MRPGIDQAVAVRRPATSAAVNRSRPAAPPLAADAPRQDCGSTQYRSTQQQCAVPADQPGGVVVLPLPRRHRILILSRRDPPVEREP